LSSYLSYILDLDRGCGKLLLRQFLAGRTDRFARHALDPGCPDLDVYKPFQGFVPPIERTGPSRVCSSTTTAFKAAFRSRSQLLQTVP
jgi:hypothetical protein